MRKRYQNFHKDEPKPIRTYSESRDLPRESLARKRRKKPKLKYFIFAVIALILVVIGYLGISSLKAANNILASNISVSSLIKQNSLKQTDGITNVLILGKGGDNHAGGQLTDTIMIARIRNSDKKIALISIPRDLSVNVPGRGVVKINEAYTQGYLNEKDSSKKNDAGAKMAEQVIQTNFNIPFHYYIVADFIGFKDLVDALGGITVNVEKNLDDPLYPKDSIVNDKLIESDAYAPVHIKAGTQEMNGDTALKYARSRETTSDFDRAKRQQIVILAVKDKMMSLGILSNPVKINGILQSLGNHIKTSFSASELNDLFAIAKDFDQSKVINKVIDNSQNGLLVDSSEGSYHLLPKSGNFLDIQKFVKNVFDAEDSVTSMVDVEVYNGTKTVGIAGKLADTLKKDGFSVTKIENSDKLYDKTTILDGTNSSKTYQEVKKIVGVAERSNLDTTGVIRIYVGKDYGN